jgi:thymidylate synthase (FAD)
MIELLDYMGTDLTVINAARVSHDKWHTEFQEVEDTRLIKYLARNNHFTPFAQPVVQFRITTPIFVARQFFRSNIGTTRNEVSRRYVESEPEFYVFERYRDRPTGSLKQGSGADVSDTLHEHCRDLQEDVEDLAMENYKEMLGLGIAPEQARALLPQTMMTSWVETSSLYFWARFCNLRLGEHAQEEIKIEARQISSELGKLFPVSWTALMEAR